jgi:hypothetical protein
MSNDDARKGTWLQTASGRMFWPLDPRPEDVLIEDVAHHLSHLCRFAGACREFYSVAEHSVHVSEHCEPKDALWGLLHDAAEAYCVDMPRPIKLHLPDYQRIEHRVQTAVLEKFGLQWPEPESVVEADARMLFTECRDLMQKPPSSWKLAREPYTNLQIYPWSPEEARVQFLSRFHELSGQGSVGKNATND